MIRILIAEDEERIVAFLEKGLRADGYNTTAVGTGREALELARRELHDLLVLDLGLPDRDGRDILRDLRAEGLHLPVIVLTARDGIGDTVGCLEQGADDYLTKPFRFEELRARVRLRLRSRSAEEPSILSNGEIHLDLRTRTATFGSRTTELTGREATLLQAFLSRPGQALSRGHLLSRVWGYDFDSDSNVVDVYVRYLRRKLGDDVVETVRGLGYRIGGPGTPAGTEVQQP